MKFEESYFRGEEREGFFVEEMMKRAWAAQIEVLQEIDAICKKYGIRYFADWGTLLGAVRHKGFVPWDDDVDITMLRDDYEKFLVVAQKELPEEYEVRNIYTVEDYTEVFTRVNNSTVIDCTKKHMEKFHGCPYIVGIDIFPQDYIPRNKEEEQIQYLMLASVIKAKDSVIKEKPDAEEAIQEAERICGVTIKRDKTVYRQLIILLDRISKMFTAEEADDVTLFHHWIVYGKGRMKKEWYDETIYLPFENIEVPAPKNYHEHLVGRYREGYMTPRCYHPHMYPFYKEQEELLQEEIRKAKEGKRDA